MTSIKTILYITFHPNRVPSISKDLTRLLWLLVNKWNMPKFFHYTIVNPTLLLIQNFLRWRNNININIFSKIVWKFYGKQCFYFVFPIIFMTIDYIAVFVTARVRFYWLNSLEITTMYRYTPLVFFTVGQLSFTLFCQSLWAKVLAKN